MRCARLFAASRAVARSGMRPRYQKRNETVAYVEIANTSHGSALLKFGQTCVVAGYGMSHQKSHGRPRWMIGYMPAMATAKSVIASAKRLMEVRHFCWKRRRIALMSVPAWPMPIHQTKLVMS